MLTHLTPFADRMWFPFLYKGREVALHQVLRTGIEIPLWCVRVSSAQCMAETYGLLTLEFAYTGRQHYAGRYHLPVA
jgi:hypothetical protein